VGVGERSYLARPGHAAPWIWVRSRACGDPLLRGGVYLELSHYVLRL